MRCVALAVVVLGVGGAHADPVKWGVGFTGVAKELTGPSRSFGAYCKRCKVGEKLAKPPKPYLAVQVTKDTPQRGAYVPVTIAIQVKRGWYFRVLGEHGQDAMPHGEKRIDQQLSIESITSRDVVPGGPPEIVVVTRTAPVGEAAYREVWVFTVDKGVPWSVNPIEGVDPQTLL